MTRASRASTTSPRSIEVSPAFSVMVRVPDWYVENWIEASFGFCETVIGASPVNRGQ
jgi:hypothetical protein